MGKHGFGEKGDNVHIELQLCVPSCQSSASIQLITLFKVYMCRCKYVRKSIYTRCVKNKQLCEWV